MEKIKNAPLPRNVKVLGLVSFFQDAASEMLYPILPIFLTATLGAPVYVVGVTEGLAEAVSSLTKVFSGVYADRYRRKPMVGFGYGLAALGKVLISVAFVWPVVVLARVVDRLGKGIRTTPRDTLISQSVPVEQHGHAFGFHRALDTAGAVVGPLLGLLLIHAAHNRLRIALVLAIIPAVISVLFVSAVREVEVPTPTQANKALLDFRGLPPEFWTAVVFIGIFSLVNFADALLILRTKAIGFSLYKTIGLYALYNAIYSLTAIPAGKLTDRLKPQLIFSVGLASFALMYLGLGLTHDHGVVVGLFAIYGLFNACTDGVSKAWITKIAPKDRKGASLGVLYGVSGIGTLISGIWAGLLWNKTGTTPLLISGSVAAVLCLFLLGSIAINLGRRGPLQRDQVRPLPQ